MAEEPQPAGPEEAAAAGAGRAGGVEAALAAGEGRPGNRASPGVEARCGP